MPRSNRPRRSASGRAGNKWARAEDDAGAPLERSRYGLPQLQSGRDGQWHVRSIAPARAGKDYTCPGCHRAIPPGTAHLVAWRADDWRGDDRAAADRRHWHTHCWATRQTGAGY
ncbi:hypothetical protein ACQ7DA_07220 [Zafaria sp. J156]|uniref:hypothetical protein n=1 Tax=Zafaria sp. J156 TaxID=3116490 RepID=UPI002E7870E9|nr:hypothetical protein [Zafaria sp. J156]MEE1620837.1 hypothetical protein [Zafaria sp. J156]